MPKFNVGDMVLARDTVKSGEFYLAKVIKVKKNDEGTNYFVHYQGWSWKWDIWLHSNHVKPCDVQIQKKNYCGNS